MKDTLIGIIMGCVLYVASIIFSTASVGAYEQLTEHDRQELNNLLESLE